MIGGPSCDLKPEGKLIELGDVLGVVGSLDGVFGGAIIWARGGPGEADLGKLHVCLSNISWILRRRCVQMLLEELRKAGSGEEFCAYITCWNSAGGAGPLRM